MKWTEAQEKTIETRGKNILVSAAAGSGKTAVLIERIKQLVIRDRTDVDRFLITTFTNAAAAEMKERLEKAVRKAMEEEGADREFLRRQLTLLRKANIGTFHNFALEVIRRYFYLTDLEPGFRIGDDIQVSIIKKECVDELFEMRFADDYDAFTEFLGKYSGDRNENRIKDNILSLHNELRSLPHYMDWAEKRNAMLRDEDPLMSMGIIEEVLRDGRESFMKAVALYGAAFSILDDEGLEALAAKAEADRETLGDVAALFDRALGKVRAGEGSPEDFDNIGEALENIKLNSMRATKDEKDSYEMIKDAVSSCRKKGKAEIDAVKKKYFREDYATYLREIKALADDTAYLTGLIAQYEDIFRSRKEDMGIIDFDDQMHYAIEILENPMAAGEYRDRFDYIFIDEFQDSNMLQEIIISKICREDNLFMVGDIKQSIYKFRLAEPEIFRRKYALYAREDTKDSIKIDLNSNFRSKMKVTETVNTIFRSMMEGYDDSASLHCMADPSHPGMTSRLTVIDSGREESEVLREKIQYEGAAASSIIKENLGKTIYDMKKDIERPMEYGDMVILARSRSSIGGLEKFLNDEGIPACGENDGGYFESVEIEVFVNLLKIIDNTRNDIPLISAMHSVIFDFDAAELARIRSEFMTGSFCDAVASYMKEGSDEGIRMRIEEMYRALDRWKKVRRTMSLEELVRTLIYDTGYYDYCGGLPAGKQRTGNLRLLAEKAAAFEKNEYSGLHGFLSYIEAMKKNKVAVGEARTVGDSENVVRIMTVHKSKGLEFPLVILAGAGRKASFKGSKGIASMQKDLGIGLPYVNREECWHRKSLLQKAIDRKKAAEELEEEIRILYVAFTRAMDRLEIIGTVKDSDELDSAYIPDYAFLPRIYEAFLENGDTVRITAPGALGGDMEKKEEETFDVEELLSRRTYIEEDSDTEKIRERLSYRYPRTGSGTARSKYSVTELNRDGVPGEKEKRLAEPAFMTEGGDSAAAEKGTLMHLIMEKIDFRRAAAEGRPYIDEAISRLEEKRYLDSSEVTDRDRENILGFFSSETGRRAAQAPLLVKEREFILMKDIEGSPAIVQGIIDCYFEDEEGLVLIDYKNVRLGGRAGEDEIKSRYEGQIALYREALEKAMGREVEDSWLYLFDSKKFVKV